VEGTFSTRWHYGEPKIGEMSKEQLAKGGDLIRRLPNSDAAEDLFTTLYGTIALICDDLDALLTKWSTLSK
jgi:hypothetical protein